MNDQFTTFDSLDFVLRDREGKVKLIKTIKTTPQGIKEFYFYPWVIKIINLKILSRVWKIPFLTGSWKK